MIYSLGGPSDLAPHPATSGRREFLQRFGLGLGSLALADMLAGPAASLGQSLGQSPGRDSGVLETLHHVPRAKRVIYLFQSGGPSQLETFDYKPLLVEQNGQQLPDSVRKGQRLTGMTG
ncbi:MAG: DUF1501 domain-containing protein, partial [Planctomycetaceae bacterium]